VLLDGRGIVLAEVVVFGEVVMALVVMFVGVVMALVTVASCAV
jgi:hypothetical protein